MQLGDLRLWSEPGPFAALVAVIRGDPPEGLHDAMRNTLSRIHAERHHALESFDGDSAGLGDVEASLRELVALGAHESPRTRLGRVIVVCSLLLLLILAAAWTAWWWYNQQLWQAYLDRLRAQPGIVITEAGKRDGKFVVSGLRDPLAVDPLALLGEAGIDPARVVARFDPYQALDPQSVLKRLEVSLDPPPSVTLSIAAAASWREVRRRTRGSIMRTRLRGCCQPVRPVLTSPGSAMKMRRTSRAGRWSNGNGRPM